VIGVAPECIDATVSTVDSQWAFSFATNLPPCPQADGYVVLRREVTGWQVQLQGSGVGACPVGHVPTRVAKDLGLCRNPRTYILCLATGRATERVWRRHPARCVTLGPRQAFAQAAKLVRLRWRGWGRPVARARGIERGFHRPLARIPVKVKAYRRRRCPFGDFIYTRLRATSRYGSLVVRYPANCGDGGQAASGRPAETADVVRSCAGGGRQLGGTGFYYGDLSVRNMRCRRARIILRRRNVVYRGRLVVPRWNCSVIGHYQDGAVFRCTRGRRAMRFSAGG
jgi:hypothetical protein